MKESDRTLDKSPDVPLRDHEEAELALLLASAPPLTDDLSPSPVDTRRTIRQAFAEVTKAQRAYEASTRDNQRQRTLLDEESKKLREERRRLEALPAREQALNEQVQQLEKREENARRGFLQEREEILSSVTREREQLRQERASAEASLRQWRSEQEQAWRQEQEARSSRWAQEEQTRTRSLAEERERQDQELRQQRERAQAALEATLHQERERSAQRLREQQDQLDARDKATAQAEMTLRQAQRHLAIKQSTLADEQQMLSDKIERLVRQQVTSERDQNSFLLQEQKRLRTECDQLHRRLQDHDALMRQFRGASPADILVRLDIQTRTERELREQLAQRPTAHDAERLRALEQQQASWHEERAGLQARALELESRLSRQLVGSYQLESLRSEKEALETQKQSLTQVNEAQQKLYQQAILELRREIDTLTDSASKQHPLAALVALDDDPTCQTPAAVAPGPAAPTDLPTLVSELQRRIYHEPPTSPHEPPRRLFYEAHELRLFLAGMAQSRLLLLQGISGTGKTSLPLSVARALGADSEVVAVQAGWRDRQDLLGHYNVLHRKYHATNFLQALYRAHTPTHAGRPSLIVLDEINLSRVEQFFADLLSALEQPDQPRLTLLGEPVADPPRHLLDGRHLPLPRNVWFVGTANHDESTVEFADKTYDRAHIMELTRAPAPPQPPPAASGHAPLSLTWLEQQFAIARERHEKTTEDSLRWLAEADPMKQLARASGVGWGNRFERDLRRFMPVFVAAGGTVHDGLDHLLVSKVLRKLRDRHDMPASSLEAILEAFARDTVLGDKLARSQGLLEREIATKQGGHLA